jgi:hypothetical protein
MILVARTSISLCQKYITVSDTDRATPISTAANLNALRGKPSTGRGAPSIASGLVLTANPLVVVGEDVLKMTGWA